MPTLALSNFYQERPEHYQRASTTKAGTRKKKIPYHKHKMEDESFVNVKTTITPQEQNQPHDENQ